jgi:hypothetical protein
LGTGWKELGQGRVMAVDLLAVDQHGKPLVERQPRERLSQLSQ